MYNNLKIELKRDKNATSLATSASNFSSFLEFCSETTHVPGSQLEACEKPAERCKKLARSLQNVTELRCSRRTTQDTLRRTGSLFKGTSSARVSHVTGTLGGWERRYRSNYVKKQKFKTGGLKI